MATWGTAALRAAMAGMGFTLRRTGGKLYRVGL